MMTKSKTQSKQADLFESIQIRPQWEKLPPTTRKELIQMLRELMLSSTAQKLLQQIHKGGSHE